MNDKEIGKREFKDTREQQIAQTYDRNISVTANAGAGKTSVLQKRFVNLLIENEELLPKEIVAITFTRNAASEIRSRITESFDKILHQELNYSQRRRLKYIRERLQSAQISTIHGFCSSLIRDYPIESGVASNFSELSASESLKIKNDAIINVFTRLLRDNNQYINILIDSFGRYKLEKMIKAILYKQNLFFLISEFYQNNEDAEIIEQAENYFNSVYFDKIKLIIDNFNDILNQILDCDLNEELISIVKDCKTVLDEINFETKVNFLNDNIFIKIITVIENLKVAEILNRSSFTLKKSKLKKCLGNETIDELNSELKELELINNLESVNNNRDKQKKLIELNRYLINLVSEIIKEIDKTKERISGLDFEDLIIKTNNMLNDEKVADKIRKRYKYIMVDEFQDTNQIQYDIIRKLVPELDKCKKTDINLFIVGDAKQSIYGFRNADVRVFKKATQDISKLNDKLISDGLLEKDFDNGDIVARNQEANGKIELSISFRHQPVIAAFVNLIFNNLEKTNQLVSDYGVEYSDFICSTNINELIAYSENQTKSKDNIGKVEFLITIKPKLGDYVSEAEKIAHYILKLVNEDNYKFSDIAIFSRVKTRFKDLIEQLQKYNIPYLLSSGKDFFRTQEVMDIVSFLKFINNQNDDLALAAILRSTFFNLNDSELYLISSIKKTTNLFKKLNYYVDNIEENSHSNIKRASNILKELLLFNSRLMISQLVLAIIDKCKWFGTFANTSSANQIKANINKFIAFTRTIEGKGFKNLSDFLDEINLINQGGIDEGEALFVSNENLVNVMSIHAAKGLEFPVVILYDTSNSGGNNDPFFVDEELGFAYKVPIYDKDKNFYMDIETPLFSAISSKTKLKEQEEEKRILYVALTRAKERLVLSTTLNENRDGLSKPQSLFKMITDCLSIDNTDIFGFSNSIPVEEKLTIYHNEQSSEIKFSFPIAIIRDVSAYNMGVHQSKNDNFQKKLLLEGIDAQEKNLNFSATRFMTYENDFDEYIKRYILRLSEADDVRAYRNSNDDDSEIVSARDLGSIIHSILEDLNEWYNSENQIDDNKFSEIIQIVSKRYIGHVTNDFINDIKKKIYKIFTTDLIKNNIEYVLKSEKEKSLTIPYANDFIEAKIDLLFKKNDNIIEIWDWKTNNVSNILEMKEMASHYKIQMQLYAYIILLEHPELESIKTRLLFTQLAKKNTKDDEWTIFYEFNRRELKTYEEGIFDRIKNIKSKNN